MQAGKNIKDPFDALMKESFLGLDQQNAKDSALMDEVAESVYSKEWPLAAGSSQAEAASVLGRGWKAWTWYLSAFLLIAGLGYGAWEFYERPETTGTGTVSNSLPASQPSHTGSGITANTGNANVKEGDVDNTNGSTPVLSATGKPGKKVFPKQGFSVLDQIIENKPLASTVNILDKPGLVEASSAATVLYPGINTKGTGETNPLKNDTASTNELPAIGTSSVSLLTEAQKLRHTADMDQMLGDMAGMHFQDYSHIKITDKDSNTTTDFYLKRAEVTNKQYSVFLQDLLLKGKTKEYEIARPKPEATWNDPKDKNNKAFLIQYFKKPAYDDYPVVCISVEGMELYCSWLKQSIQDYYTRHGKTLSLDVRLPAEKEWKLAASEGKKSHRYGTANGRLKSVAWLSDSYAANYAETQTKFVAQNDTVIALGKKKHGKKDMAVTHKLKKDMFTSKAYANPSHFQLSNMSGNVSEVVSAKTAEGTRYRSIGGNWNSSKSFLKINAPDEFNGRVMPSPYIGFRPVIMMNNK